MSTTLQQFLDQYRQGYVYHLEPQKNFGNAVYTNTFRVPNSTGGYTIIQQTGLGIDCSGLQERWLLENSYNIPYMYTALVMAQAGEQLGVKSCLLPPSVHINHVSASAMRDDVLPEKRMGGCGVRLLLAFEPWCKNRKVVEINLGINSLAEMDSVGAFVRKMVYAKVGENFVKGMV